MSDAAEKVQDVVADAAAEVAQQAEGVEQFVRSMNQVKMQYGLLGFAIGTAVGGVAAFAIAYRRAEMKYSKFSEEEISEMKEHYQEKVRALEQTSSKGNLEEIVAERGYSVPDDSKPPMAVAPPTPVVEAAAEATEESKEELLRVRPPEATVVKESEVRNVFKDADEDAKVTDSWNYTKELQRRSPEIPYVIHYDERGEFDDYTEVTWTYFEGDDVLCREDDSIVDPDQRDMLVGEKNLSRFGHGSNDPSVVYVRNDKLEMMIELVRSTQEYGEEVHGFEHGGYSHNLERMRAREHEDLDDG